MTIKNFTIFGERCSGTNFLENVIKENFGLEITFKYAWKHFFCNSDLSNSDETLFIGIVRNPIYWLNSLYKDKHHIPVENLQSIQHFLFNKAYSVCEATSPRPRVLKNDFNYVTNKPYKNIFEMRRFKNRFLTDIMPTKVKNYILINYEALTKHYEYTLNKIQSSFNLPFKNPNAIIKVNKYKKETKRKFVSQKKIELDTSTLVTIWKNLDVAQENSLGYYIGDDNQQFKLQENIKFIITN
uniref:Sulfotransferase domain-containing protein n=1 Tax=viral metagenome TaxID=1070528 RepID=A0A6C0ITR2_9ZZZZ